MSGETGIGMKRASGPIFTVRNALLFLLVASVFVTTFYIRAAFSSELAYVNVMFYGILLILALRYRGSFNVVGILCWMGLVAIFLSVELLAGTGLRDMFKSFFLYCAPLLVCQMTFVADDESWLRMAETTIRLVNVFTMTVFLVLVIDLLTSSAVMRWLTSWLMMDMVSWVSPNPLHRHASIWGHYLITAGFYLVFYFLNIAHTKVTNSHLIDVRLLYVVATLGILSTGGKTALIIYLVSIVWLNVGEERGLRNAAALTLFLLGLYFLGAFDIVLGRFSADDLSSGRNDSVTAVLIAERPPLLGGYGETYMFHMSALVGFDTAAMFSEYSLLALSFKYGVSFVVLAVFLILRMPFASARRTGRWSLAFMAAMLVVYFSTFNGLVWVPDAYLVIAVFVLCVNLLSGCGDRIPPQKWNRFKPRGNTMASGYRCICAAPRGGR